MQHTELRRTGKFLLFSCSAGLIELGSFALFNEVFHWLMPTPWPLPVTVKVNVPPL